MLNILVTGSNGQLGSEIQELSSHFPYTFFFTCKEKLDITNEHALHSFIEAHAIHAIINCAAYTAVDKAESEEALADKIVESESAKERKDKNRLRTS
jgi:dTDP-4-dehydrorhamnose reductase